VCMWMCMDSHVCLKGYVGQCACVCVCMCVCFVHVQQECECVYACMKICVDSHMYVWRFVGQYTYNERWGAGVEYHFQEI